MRKPNFFLVGAPKCGTTAMYNFLKQHPEIYMSPDKEPHFFAPEIAGEKITFYSKPRFTEEDKYLSLFDGATTEKIRGEASACYLLHLAVPERLVSFSPDAKILVSLREPRARLISYYNYYTYLIGNVKHTYNEFENEYFFENEEVNPHLLFFPYIQKYYSIFGDKMKAVLFSEFKKDNVATMQKIYSFLEVDPTFIPELSDFIKSGKPKNRVCGILSDTLTRSADFSRRMGLLAIIKKVHPSDLKILSRFRARALTKDKQKLDINPELEHILNEDWKQTMEFCKEKNLLL